jgi:glutathione S-transferase
VESVTLLQFPFSHYNEKARWALDWKGIPHRRVDFLPGPHAPQILRLTGKTTTPVLRIGERVIAGSAAILDELERLQPEPALYPADPTLRARALELQRHFDEEVGPRVRRALFSVLVREPAYMCRIFAGKRTLPVRALYRALFPVTKRVMGGSMALFDPVAVEDAFRGTRDALDLVAKSVEPSGQLVGQHFSVADLTAAANFALLVQVPHPDMARPTPIPAPVQEFMARFEAHPAIAWTLEQYRRHRPPHREET